MFKYQKHGEFSFQHVSSGESCDFTSPENSSLPLKLEITTGRGLLVVAKQRLLHRLLFTRETGAARCCGQQLHPDNPKLTEGSSHSRQLVNSIVSQNAPG